MNKNVPRGIRNNNPGNIRNSERNDWAGEIPADHKQDNAFEEFEDMQHGVRAMMKLLLKYHTGYGLKSVKEIINRWAPRNENNTSGYIRRVCQEMQIPDSLPIDLTDKGTMCALAAAISLVENGISISDEDIEKGWNLL